MKRVVLFVIMLIAASGTHAKEYTFEDIQECERAIVRLSQSGIKHNIKDHWPTNVYEKNGNIYYFDNAICMAGQRNRLIVVTVDEFRRKILNEQKVRAEKERDSNDRLTRLGL